MKLTWEEFCAKRNIKIPTSQEEEKKEETGTFNLSITLDADQKMAVELALAGKSFCLIGKAGTGKTTTEREIVRALLKRNNGATHDFRIQGSGVRKESAAAAVVAYTRIASGNSRNAICKDPDLEEQFFHNVTTIHNLLEFAPEFFYDAEKDKESMRFVPKRNSSNPLTTKVITFEEASMIDLTLWEKVYDAMLYGTQCIFVGDINQLPPVFGPSILNYALVQLPIVELNTVYRQAFNSNVLLNAHNILEGRMVEEFPDFRILEGGEKQYGQTVLMHRLSASIKKWYEDGTYDPKTDIFLTPFNKQDLGSDNINSHIAQIIGTGEVWEVIAGIRKLYLSVGDKVMYNKQVGIITKIARNGQYAGRPCHPPSVNMTRFGVMAGQDDIEDEDGEDDGLAHFNLDLEKMEKQDLEELSRQSSHILDIDLDTGEKVTIWKVGDFTQQVLSLAYALTIHKSQGCEWRKVFICLHKDHSIMAFNELLYTAVTRAAKEIVIIGKKYMIKKAIDTRRLKGNSIKEKIEYFNANLTLTGVKCTK